MTITAGTAEKSGSLRTRSRRVATLVFLVVAAGLAFSGRPEVALMAQPRPVVAGPVDGSIEPNHRVPDGATPPVVGKAPVLLPPIKADAPVCRNSTNPLCGPFRWDPDPGDNAPVVMSVECSTMTPTVGEKVTCTIQATDADAPIEGYSVEYPGLIDPIAVKQCAKHPYGPWTPPARVAGSQTFTWTHVFKTAGPAELTFHAYSGHPYWWSVANAESEWDSIECGTPKSPYESRSHFVVTLDVQEQSDPA